MLAIYGGHYVTRFIKLVILESGETLRGARRIN